MAAINRSTDMTTGSIWKRMVSFAVPVFLGNLCQQLYNTVDSVIVGKFVGKQALAAVASSGNLIFLLTGIWHPSGLLRSHQIQGYGLHPTVAIPFSDGK